MIEMENEKEEWRKRYLNSIDSKKLESPSKISNIYLESMDNFSEENIKLKETN